ncbi:MAG: hypothetical protein V1681_03825, partial [Candidatus Neomarinimicrobiota bacterium]
MKRNKYKSQKKTARIDVLVVVLSLSTSLFAEKGFRLLTTISGEKAGDQFCTVKNIGDVNGDGFNDLLVGAAEASYTKLYYGGSDFDTVADLVMRVPKHYDYFGQTLATGDLNNDGFSDFAIGAPYYDEYDRCGKIFVYFGGTGIDSTADMEIEGYGYWHLMGSSIVCNCDVNGDGYQDLLTCSGQYPRKTYIYFGGANMDNVPDIYLAGKDSIICNVGGPSGIGDINNDGYDDFFVTITSEVGMPNLLPGTGNYLIYGGENISLENSVIFKIDSTFGSRLDERGVGDLNNDGCIDLCFSYTDCIILYSGLTLLPVQYFKRPNGEGHYYSTSSERFDINNDNYNDIIYTYFSTETEYYGNVALYLGSSELDSVSDYEVSQGPNGIGFGRSCSFLGDINDDGKPEIAVGALGGTGKVYIYSFGDFQDRIDDTNVEKLDEFSILKAYPNPFNPKTTISFDLPEEAKVEIVVYDLMGREIWKSAKTHYSAGTYSIVWNGTNHSG